MDNVTIRPFESADRVEVSDLVNDFQSSMALLDPSGEAKPFRSSDDLDLYIDQMLRDVQQREGILLTAADNNARIIGFASGVVIRRPSADDVMYATTHDPAIQGWIGLLFVAEVHRGGGIGKRLLEAMRMFFESKDCTSLHLLVNTNNLYAVGLYQEFGLQNREIEMSMPL